MWANESTSGFLISATIANRMMSMKKTMTAIVFCLATLVIVGRVNDAEKACGFYLGQCCRDLRPGGAVKIKAERVKLHDGILVAGLTQYSTGNEARAVFCVALLMMLKAI